MTWHLIALTSPLDEGTMQRVEVAGKGVVVARMAGRLHAFAATCPHASAELVEGTLRRDYVICPLHSYRFDLTRGTCLKPLFGPRLRIYEVKEADDAIWVKVE